MSWSEVFSRVSRVAIALVVVYVAGAALYIVGGIVSAKSLGFIEGFDILGLSVRFILGLAFSMLAMVVITLGTLAIGIKVLTESVTDHIIQRMESEGPK